MAVAPQRFGRERVVALAGLGVVATIGWLVFVHMSTGMTGMEAAAVMMTRPLPSSSSGYGSMVAMWAAMMTAMMAPAASQGLSAYLVLARRQPKQDIALAAASFCAGYWPCGSAMRYWERPRSGRSPRWRCSPPQARSPAPG